jgi:hypothetical protein
METIAFGMHLPTNDTPHRLAYYIVALTAHTLWTTRNRKVAGKTTEPTRLHHHVIHKIKQRVQAEERRDKTKTEGFWGQGNIILQYTTGTLTYNI